MELYDLHGARALRWAAQQVGPGNEAEEVVHDVFFALWQGHGPSAGCVGAWLRRQVGRHARRMRRLCPEIADQWPEPTAGGGRPDPCTGLVPPAWLREGLAHACGEVGRFHRHAAQLRRLLGRDGASLEALLFALDDPARWQAGHTQRVYTLRPEADGALVFFRVAPGQPLHAPVPQPGARALLLQGLCRGSDGRTYAAGSTLCLASAGAATPPYLVLPDLEALGAHYVEAFFTPQVAPPPEATQLAGGAPPSGHRVEAGPVCPGSL